jgi:hypothetical protein
MVTEIGLTRGWAVGNSGIVAQYGDVSFGNLNTYTFSHARGWNIVSIPVTVSDYRRAIVLPNAISNAYTFSPSSGYVQRDTLANGPGYWLKFGETQADTIVGLRIPGDTISVASGWNLIGSITDGIPITAIVSVPPSNVVSQYYGYSTTGYYGVTVIAPAKGYWVKARDPGVLILLSSTGFAKSGGNPPVASILSDFDFMNIKDAWDRSQSLYFGEMPAERLFLDYFELPPLPPSGMFDARFASDRMLELVKEGNSGEFPVSVSSAQYPITISWQLHPNSVSAILMIDGKEVVLGKRGSTQVTNPRAGISLKLIAALRLPREYALGQNYPNPFNPATTIKYQLPQECKVTLQIFNLLGQEVATLVNELKQAGRYEMQWNAENFPSGVYFYRLRAGEFVRSMKLVILR